MVKKNKKLQTNCYFLKTQIQLCYTKAKNLFLYTVQYKKCIFTPRSVVLGYEAKM